MIKCEQCGGGCEQQPLYMHSRCHVPSPTYAVRFGDVLSVFCAECDKKIGAFKVEGDATELEPTCHPEAETWAVLSGHSQDLLTIQCSTCDKEIASFKFLGIAPRES